MACMLKEHNMLDKEAHCTECGHCGWNTTEDALRHSYIERYGLQEVNGKKCFVTPKVW